MQDWPIRLELSRTMQMWKWRGMPSRDWSVFLYSWMDRTNLWSVLYRTSLRSRLHQRLYVSWRSVWSSHWRMSLPTWKDGGSLWNQWVQNDRIYDRSKIRSIDCLWRSRSNALPFKYIITFYLNLPIGFKCFYVISYLHGSWNNSKTIYKQNLNTTLPENRTWNVCIISWIKDWADPIKLFRKN